MKPMIPIFILAMLAFSAAAQAQRAAQGLQAAQAQQAPPPVAAQGAAPGIQGPGANAGPRPMPEGAIEIQTLVEQVAAETGQEFIVDPRVAGSWGVTTSEDVDYETLLGILRMNDLIAIETADQILVTSAMFARSLPTRLLQEDDRSVSDHEIVTRVIQVPSITVSRPAGSDDAAAAATLSLATQLVPVLRPMMPQSAQLGAVPNTNALVLVDRYDNIRRMTAVIEEIIEGLDD